MGWKITRDYLHESNVRRFGGEENLPSYYGKSMKDKQSRNYKGGNDFRVKVYDDDNTLYYEAVCDCEESAERFHDWSMMDSGTVASKIKEKGKEWGNFIS